MGSLDRKSILGSVMKDAHGITIDISVPILKGRDGYQA